MDDSNTNFGDILNTLLSSATQVASSFLSRGTGQQPVTPAAPAATAGKMPAWLEWGLIGAAVLFLVFLVVRRT